MKNKKWLVIVPPLFLIGCVSQIVSLEEYTRDGIGQSVENIKELVLHPNSYASRIGWKETTYQLDNGSLVYVEPDRPDCFIHWEINPKGIVIGSHIQGASATAATSAGVL